MGETTCSPELHEYRLDELDGVTKDHEERIKRLEANQVEMRQEFAYVKKEIAEQKSLTLEMSVKSQDKMEKLFEQVFSLLSNNQKGKTEITKQQLLMYGTIITGATTVIVEVISHIWK